ncbi:hypothetical protein GQ607_004985 [Colletotrichum asianum]|uniref:Uncharacterized protein n=1 Tax=Colletotrichum asianum TaxID=702518 RepID=A0A8H3ZV25_9PEZI|nr:hypothetical protein GQ607_004985 [Colletotrichum asianum]
MACLSRSFRQPRRQLASIDAFASAFGTQYTALFNLDIKQYSQAFITATIAATAVTAVIFVLFLTSAFAFSRELYRHRRGKVRGTDEAIGPESADRRKSSSPSAPDDDALGHRQQAPELQACEVLETQAPDPRYHTAELEDSRRRVELE